MIALSMLICGLVAFGGGLLYKDMSLDGRVIIIYLGFILGVLLVIAHTLEKSL